MRERGGSASPCEFVVARSARCGNTPAYEITVQVEGIVYNRSLCRPHLLAVSSSRRVAGTIVRIEPPL